MRRHHSVLILFVAAIALFAISQAAAEPIAKVLVSQRGVVGVSAWELHRAGVGIGDLPIDEITVSVLGHPVASVVDDLDGNGLFDGADRIVFFGQRLRGENVYRYRYADEATYLIERSAPESHPAVEPRPDVLGPTHALHAGNAPSVQRRLHIEEDIRWDRFSVARAYETDFSFLGDLDPIGHPERTFQFDAPGLDRSADASFTLSVHLFGRSSQRVRLPGVPDHLLSVSLNGVRLGDITFNGRRAHDAVFTVASPEILRPSGNEFTVTINQREEVMVDVAMIDWFEIQYPIHSALFGGQGEFALADSPIGQRCAIAGLPSPHAYIFDLTQDQVVDAEISPEASGFQTAIFDTTSEDGLYAIATDGQLLRPGRVLPFAPEMPLHPETGAEYVIITHPDFREAAERLAAHRREHDGFTTAVIDIQAVYDLFNHGIPHIRAIPAALRHIWTEWPEPRLRYVALMGDASWNWHQVESGTVTFIPTQFFSGHTIEFASDNEFAFLTDDSIPTVAIGRIPVSTADEAAAVVDKLIAFDQTISEPIVDNDWRSRILFAASSDPDFHRFLDDTVDTHVEGKFDVSRVYAYGDTVMDCTQSIIDTVNSGISFLSFVGHGSRYAWQTAMARPTRSVDYRANFNPQMIEELTNGTQLPLVFGITCFTNNFDNPDPRNCIGEMLLLHPGGGAIAIIATSSYSFVFNDLRFCGELFETLFDTSPERIGDLMLNTMQRDDVLLHDRIAFLLLGDPATPLPLVQLTPHPASGE